MTTLSTVEPSAALTLDRLVLPAVVDAVTAAGRVLLDRTPLALPPRDLRGVVAAIDANDEASLAVLRPALEAARPEAGWVEDELGAGALPAGAWWVTDSAEGNINHVQGMGEWGVTATLVRDNRAVLTAVHVPLTGDTYTAVRGGGAFLNGAPISVSSKAALAAALVGTGQARPGEEAETFRLIGSSVTAMLGAALTVRVSVPATIPLLHVAAGRMDAFWQHSGVRSGLMAGALLVEEAGGLVTDLDGRSWAAGSPDILAAAPGVHAAALAALRQAA